MSASASVRSAGKPVTENACKLCTPLGACLAFRGVEGAMPLLHGSQGCATYIRRFLIGHFREPIDIASSSFNEDSAIFGGERNLHQALTNVTASYSPKVIGVASTCLSETIGDDVAMMLRTYQDKGQDAPLVVQVSTPSYRGSHVDGFHAATRALAQALAGEDAPAGAAHQLNLFTGMVSPMDQRYLHEVCQDFGLEAAIAPDYSETLDGPILADYERLPSGGTPLDAWRWMSGAQASLFLGHCVPEAQRASQWLQSAHGVPEQVTGLPIGVRESDKFFQALEYISGTSTPAKHAKERGRLIDAYVDAHKYVFGKRVAVYGEEDLAVGLTAFLAETGMTPVLCASGGRSGRMEAALAAMPWIPKELEVASGADFDTIGQRLHELKPDLMVGHSKGYALARALDVPLVRAGFPISDRVGGGRVPHLGYRGAHQFFDNIVNTLIAQKQDASPVGYLTM